MCGDAASDPSMHDLPYEAPTPKVIKPTIHEVSSGRRLERYVTTLEVEAGTYLEAISQAGAMLRTGVTVTGVVRCDLKPMPRADSRQYWTVSLAVCEAV